MTLEQVGIVCEYPFSLKNGASFWVLDQHLSGLHRTQILSVYLSDRQSCLDNAFAGECLGVPTRGAGPIRLLSIFIGALWILFARGGALRRNNRTFLLVPSSTADLALAWFVSFFLKRTAVWWMDDFVNRPDFPWIKRWLAKAMARQLHRKASVRIAIGHEMAENYEKAYGIPVESILGRKARSVRDARDFKRRPGTLRLVALGSYDWPYFEAFAALKRVIASGIEDVEVDLFGMRPPAEELLLEGKIRYQGPIREEDWRDRAATYDCALLFYSFSKEARSYLKLSFPSKLAEYLAEGLPVWTVGPSQIQCLSRIRARQLGPETSPIPGDRLEEQALASQLIALRDAPTEHFVEWSGHSLRWAREEFVFRPGELLDVLSQAQDRSQLSAGGCYFF